MSAIPRWADDMTAEPRWATSRTDRPTHGGRVAEVAAALGFELQPWQRQVLDTALEHVDGRLCYRDCLVSIPRQQGKSTMALALVIWRLLAAPSTHAVYGAQSRLGARQKLLDDWLPLLNRSRLSKAFTATRASGQEAIRSTGNGSICRVISSDETAGHGETLSLAIVDEAWAVGSEVEQALKPTMLTRSAAQLWVTSTVGSSRSTWWRSKVEAGREAVEQGRTSGVCYFEWSALPGAELHDPAVWASCMPALGHTVDPATVAADIASMRPSEARRAYLNQWSDEDDTVGWDLIDREAWEATSW